MTLGSSYRAQERLAKKLYERARIEQQIVSAEEIIGGQTIVMGLAPSGLTELDQAFVRMPGRVTAAEKRLDEAKKAQGPNQAGIDEAMPGSQSSLTAAEAEAWSKPFSYFVGKNVVTQEEIDALMSRHYRWAEAAINLVIPTIFLYIAVCMSVRGLWIPLGGVLMLVVILLVAGGQRLSFRYKIKVRELIAGRLEKIKAAENKEIGTIQGALVAAEKLLAKYKAELDDLRESRP